MDVWDNTLFPLMINLKIPFLGLSNTQKNADSVNVRFVRISFLKSETLPVLKKKKWVNSLGLCSFLLYFEAGRTRAEFGRFFVKDQIVFGFMGQF